MDLTITKFDDRRSNVGTVVTLTWDQLVDQLSQPIRTFEFTDEYAAMTNEQKTAAKDVGGFVGGELIGGKRSKATVKNRTLLTIDADEASLKDVYDFRRNPCIGTPLYFVHTTHTSTGEALRLRWIFPLLRPVNSVEYRALVSVVAQWVGETSLDASTDQPERLMFWPSSSFDGDYQYWSGGIEALDPDRWLDPEELDCAEPEVVYDSIEDTALVEKETSETTVFEGGRNVALFSKAVALHHQEGLSRQEAYALLSKFNEENCSPPLPDSELRTAFNSAWGYSAEKTPASKDFADIGRWANKDEAAIAKHASKVEKSPKIKLESFKSLLSRDIAPPTYVVDNLIATGLTILASPPKYGKSWFCMALALDVANGDDFLGMHTHKTDVLYLALEDGDWRLQDRGLKVNGGVEPTDHAYIRNEAPTLGDGLVYSLEATMQEAPIGLIIIDTLQKVRNVAGKTEGVYGYDYRELGALQKFAIKNNVAVVVVHHLNKGGDDSDFVSRLNGSSGLSGAADSIITLTRSNRSDKDTKMSIVGRDINERTLILRMNWQKFRWENLGEEQDVKEDETDVAFRNDPVVKTIVYELDEVESLVTEDYQENVIRWTCTSKDLLDAVNRHVGNVEFQTPSAIGMHVSRIADEMMNRIGISYKYDVNGNTKRHVFERILM